MVHPLRIECIDDVVQWKQLEEDWRRLTGAHFMRAWEWQWAWWSGYQATRELSILVARSERGVEGILPLVAQRKLLFGRELSWIGAGEGSGDDLGMLSTNESMVACAEAFAQWLAGRSDWDRLNLDGLRLDDGGNQVLATALQRANLHIQIKESPSYWRVELPLTWEEYLASLSKRARKILRDSVRDDVSNDSRSRDGSACQDGIGPSRLRVAENRQEGHEFVAALERLHQARWQSRGHVGCFQGGRFGRMLHDAIDRLELGRKVEVLVIERNGEWISGGFVLMNSDAYAVYAVGMDPAYQDLRPGWLFFAEAIRRAIRLKKKYFDLMRGDEAYKERLGASPILQQRWVIPGKSLLPQLRYGAYLAGSLVKKKFIGLGLARSS